MLVSGNSLALLCWQSQLATVILVLLSVLPIVGAPSRASAVEHPKTNPRQEEWRWRGKFARSPGVSHDVVTLSGNIVLDRVSSRHVRASAYGNLSVPITTNEVQRTKFDLSASGGTVSHCCCLVRNSSRSAGSSTALGPVNQSRSATRGQERQPSSGDLFDMGAKHSVSSSREPSR